MQSILKIKMNDRHSVNRSYKSAALWTGEAISFATLNADCPNGTKEVGSYHSHPGPSGGFSRDDLEVSGSRGPFGLGRPGEDPAIVTPIRGTAEVEFGTVTGVIGWEGWSVGDSGELIPASVLPDGNGGFTSRVNRYP